MCAVHDTHITCTWQTSWNFCFTFLFTPFEYIIIIYWKRRRRRAWMPSRNHWLRLLCVTSCRCLGLVGGVLVAILHLVNICTLGDVFPNGKSARTTSSATISIWLMVARTRRAHSHTARRWPFATMADTFTWEKIISAKKHKFEIHSQTITREERTPHDFDSQDKE